jgi:hypothetical protein
MKSEKEIRDILEDCIKSTDYASTFCTEEELHDPDNASAGHYINQGWIEALKYVLGGYPSKHSSS